VTSDQTLCACETANPESQETVPLNKDGSEFFAALVNYTQKEAPVFDINRMNVSRQMRAGCEAAGEAAGRS
jgi:hypothetical protein